MNWSRPEREHIVGQQRDDGCLDYRVGNKVKEKGMDFRACL